MNKITKLKLLIILLSAVFFTGACTTTKKSNKDKEMTNTSITDKKIGSKGNAFAAKMLSRLSTEKKGENILLSPLSMQYLLAMVADGASEKPLAELLAVMGYSDCSLDELNDYYGTLSSTLPAADKKVDLLLTNSVWVQQGFPIDKSFSKCMSQVFNAQVKSIDFKHLAEAKKELNAWCDKSTKGLIKETSLEINSDMKLVLANASYFNGTWTNPFEKDNTDKRMFYLSSGKSIPVDMMYQSEFFGYSKNADYEAVELPYGNRTFNMLLILPAKSAKTDDLAEKMDWNNVKTQQIKLDLSLPRFKMESHWKDFDATLKALGIKQVLTAGSQLDKIAPQLFVAKVAQDACIEVNEQGTEAAAVSMGGIMLTSAGPAPENIKIIFNRPFLFAVRDNNSGAILFMGKVENPQGK